MNKELLDLIDRDLEYITELICKAHYRSTESDVREALVDAYVHLEDIRKFVNALRRMVEQ